MGKKVVVIASGETEKRSLPHLLDHLKEEDIELIDIRVPTPTQGSKARHHRTADKGSMVRISTQ